MGHALEGLAGTPGRGVHQPPAENPEHAARGVEQRHSRPSLEHGCRLETGRRRHACLCLLESSVVELDVVMGGLVPRPVLQAGRSVVRGSV